MEKEQLEHISLGRGLLALSPLFVFVLFYLVLSLILHDFYSVPLSVAFVVASVWGLLTTRGIPLAKRVEVFSAGAANKDVVYMVWIFILAGMFAVSAQKMGATEAVVDATLNILPADFILPGIFLAACFVSMAVGTSVGTVVALTPVAVGLASGIGVSVPLFVGVVVGGAFFGDNLSFISDTTIASTQSQECSMDDKFKVNIWITLPAALAMFALYWMIGHDFTAPLAIKDTNWILIIPYILVILTAIMGLNVLLVLVLGVVSSFVFGVALTDITAVEMLGFMGDGVASVGDLIVVTLLAAGMLGVIRHNEGITFVIERLSKGVKGKRGAQAVVSAMVGIVNVCTANNTIAILTVGELSRNISYRYDLDRRKTASLLDTCSCVVQCCLPYGAQVMMAASLSGISPMEIVPNLYYAFALGLAVVLSIIFRFPRRYS